MLTWKFVSFICLFASFFSMSVVMFSFCLLKNSKWIIIVNYIRFVIWLLKNLLTRSWCSCILSRFCYIIECWHGYKYGLLSLPSKVTWKCTGYNKETKQLHPTFWIFSFQHFILLTCVIQELHYLKVNINHTSVEDKMKTRCKFTRGERYATERPVTLNIRILMCIVFSLCWLTVVIMEVKGKEMLQTVDFLSRVEDWNAIRLH